ncbi:MAG: tRNA pseudouridine(38-40) synthase TruA [Candidatus Berkiellales bacterium]
MNRIVLGVEYHGANYAGWQRQHHRPSIQAILEKAVAKVADHPIALYCAGRTDAGVHATGQVVHFDTTAERPQIAWIRGVNANLPADIRVWWSRNVTDEFHARRSALSRRYFFVIFNRSISPGVLHRSVTWVRSPLNETLMQQGATYLLGKHDFTSFRTTQCQAKSPVRTIFDINVFRRKDKIILNISANAFLHHMVRNIAGTLIQIGQQKQPPSWVEEVLTAKNRQAAGITAPASGLYLAEVHYPSQFDIPFNDTPLWFLG